MLLLTLLDSCLALFNTASLGVYISGRHSELKNPIYLLWMTYGAYDTLAVVAVIAKDLLVLAYAGECAQIIIEKIYFFAGGVAWMAGHYIQLAIAGYRWYALKHPVSYYQKRNMPEWSKLWKKIGIVGSLLSLVVLSPTLLPTIDVQFPNTNCTGVNPFITEIYRMFHAVALCTPIVASLCVYLRIFGQLIWGLFKQSSNNTGQDINATLQKVETNMLIAALTSWLFSFGTSVVFFLQVQNPIFLQVIYRIALSNSPIIQLALSRDYRQIAKRLVSKTIKKVFANGTIVSMASNPVFVKRTTN